MTSEMMNRESDQTYYTVFIVNATTKFSMRCDIIFTWNNEEQRYTKAFLGTPMKIYFQKNLSRNSISFY